MSRYTFPKISCKATFRWKDKEGKHRQQTEEFFQTVNPFNLDDEGNPKNPGQIRLEIWAERDAWLTLMRESTTPTAKGGTDA